MGLYLNPGSQRFFNALNSPIYIDKTEMITYLNSVVNTEQKYVCVSRPRRFEKLWLPIWSALITGRMRTAAVFLNQQSFVNMKDGTDIMVSLISSVS